jgi:hypothetical protein
VALLLGIAVIVGIVGAAWWADRGLGANEIPTEENRDARAGARPDHLQLRRVLH